LFRPQATKAASRIVGRLPAAIPAAVVAFAVLVVAAPAARAAIPQFTPITASVLAPPKPVSATDGRRHVVYELLVRNTTEVSVDVQSLAVRENGRTLRTFAGADLTAVMTTARSHTSTLASGEGATVWLDLVLRRARRVPRGLVHRITVRATLPSGESRTLTFDGARTPVSRRPALALAPPLHGGPYLNFNGCCGLSPHRTALVPVDGTPYLAERFAADFIRIDKRGRAAVGDLTRNESFFTFGEAV
jgi:hypothetical protein